MNTNKIHYTLILILTIFYPALLWAGNHEVDIFGVNDNTINHFSIKPSDLTIPESSLLIKNDDFFDDEIAQEQEEIYKILEKENTPPLHPLAKAKDQFNKKFIISEIIKKLKGYTDETEEEFAKERVDINDKNDRDDNCHTNAIISFDNNKEIIPNKNADKKIDNLPFAIKEIPRKKKAKAKENKNSKKQSSGKKGSNPENKNNTDDDKTTNKKTDKVLTLFEENGLCLRMIGASSKPDEGIKKERNMLLLWDTNKNTKALIKYDPRYKYQENAAKTFENIYGKEPTKISENPEYYLSSATLVVKDIPTTLFKPKLTRCKFGVILKQSTILWWGSGLKGEIVTKHLRKSPIDYSIKPLKLKEYNETHQTQELPIEDIIKLYRKLYKENNEETTTPTVEYNEALIHYKTKDIIGIFIGENKNQKVIQASSIWAYHLKKHLLGDSSAIDYYFYAPGKLTKIDKNKLEKFAAYMLKNITRCYNYNFDIEFI